MKISHYLFVVLCVTCCLGSRAHAQDTLIATEILGRPTNNSVTVNAVAGYDAEAFVMYGTVSGNYTNRTDTMLVPVGNPIEIIVGNLTADTRYFYRFCYRRAGTTPFTLRDEHYFHTQRARGSSFRFTVEADPHLYDKKGSSTLMHVALENERRDSADFLMDLGDTFGDDHYPTTITSDEVWQLHLNYRPFFGAVCHSSPLFFCLGNHEGENGYFLNQNPPNNLAVYATLARQFYYPNPVPDSFYSGNTVAEGYGMGLPENYYSWEWGDALFVVLDVYRHYTASEKPGGWDWTIGDQQYAWLKQTLESSTAKYKFVFAHHVLGQTRGAAGWANKFEWGGYEANGTTWGFDTHRPGWAMPIHQLMVANGVTIFIQGHDHLFAKESLDGLVYQEVPMPCDSTYIIGMENAPYYTADTLPPSGTMRVNVSPQGVQVDYVKAVEPWDETPSHPNGEVAYSYTIGAVTPKYSLTVLQSPNGVIAPGTTLVDSGATQRFAFTPQSGYHLDSIIIDGNRIADSTSGYTFYSVASNHTITAGFGPDSVMTVDTLLAGELLGRPTATSVTLNLIPGVDMAAFVEYGVFSGSYVGHTDTVIQSAGKPIEILIGNLAPDTRYYYRLRYKAQSAGYFEVRPEHTFHTQRFPGSTFVFNVQADPHLGNPSSLLKDTAVDTSLYKITLQNELADNPDFLLDLGDTFMNEKYYGASYDLTRQAYLAHRPYFGLIGHSVPLFLVNGNHEGELGWTLNGTANNLALWSVRARNLYYPNPIPGGFYSGSSAVDPNLILDTNIVRKVRDGYYAYEWGNALFIALDPFWYTAAKPGSYTTNADEGWKFTLGETQFSWLKRTLEQSKATFKFVFIHNLTGGNSKDGRGGIEAAGFYEWGGKDIGGVPEWDAKRAWTEGPIHSLLVAHNVSMLLHGHDHFFCKQQLDGIIYQECPQPGNKNYNDIPGSAAQYGYINGSLLGNSGYLRFTVSDTAARVEYVRSYLPADETPSRHNRDVANTYTITAPKKTTAIQVAGGWNLVSLPYKVSSPEKTSVYPTASSEAYSFNAGYSAHTILTTGKGYWLKFGGLETVQLTGVPFYAESVSVSEGWNLIGGISDPIPAGSIQSDPPELITGRIFGFGPGGYYDCDTLKPGNGYWVKAASAGKLFLTSVYSASVRQKSALRSDGELPPAPPGEEQTLSQRRPRSYGLNQVFPNPFNPATTIQYQLPEESRVRLSVINTLGQEVALLSDAIEPAGVQSVSWDGSRFASGLYYYRLEAASLSDPTNHFSQAKKMLLIK